MKEKAENEMFSFSERVIKEVVKKDDEYTKQVIRDYFIKRYPKENLRFDFLNKEIVDEIIKLGITEYQRRQALGGVLRENSIEKIKKQLELILKVRKEQKEIIECAGGACINCDPDIKALSESIEILSDYERVLKENEEQKREIERQKDINTIINKKGIDKYYEKVLEKTMTKFLNDNIANDFIPKKKVKEKIKELEEKMKYEYNRIILVQLFKQRKVLQELLNK